jgi:hypothetical protein
MTFDLLFALGAAVVLGLRHATDPDHLVAVTTLTATEGGGHRAATALGAWWGLGHAITLGAVGLPLIALESTLPVWLEGGAERLVGVVIAVLALRVLLRWVRRDPDPPRIRSTRDAFGIGVLHGLAGTGAVVLVLIAALPTQWGAAAALALFAPMTAVSMAALSGAFAWAMTRPAVAPIYRVAVIPALGAFGLMFGVWYAAIA